MATPKARFTGSRDTLQDEAPRDFSPEVRAKLRALLVPELRDKARAGLAQKLRGREHARRAQTLRAKLPTRLAQRLRERLRKGQQASEASRLDWFLDASLATPHKTFGSLLDEITEATLDEITEAVLAAARWAAGQMYWSRQEVTGNEAKAEISVVVALFDELRHKLRRLSPTVDHALGVEADPSGFTDAVAALRARLEQAELRLDSERATTAQREHEISVEMAVRVGRVLKAHGVRVSGTGSDHNEGDDIAPACR